VAHRWTGQLQSNSVVQVFWSGTSEKPPLALTVADSFNPSIPRVRRTEDGGFGTAPARINCRQL
jgi:hypothetical protein